MIQILLLDFVAISLLVGVAIRKGVEGALPLFALLMVTLPQAAKLPTGALDITPQRFIVITLATLYVALPRKNPTIYKSYCTPLAILIVCQSIWCLGSTLNSVEILGSVKAMIAIVLEYYLVYMIAMRSISRIETVERILYAMVFGIGTLCIFGWVEAYTGWNVVNQVFPIIEHRFSYGIDIQRGIRVSVTYPHAILYGAALALTIPTALYLISIAQTTRRKIILWAFVIPMFLNIYKTVSRGPWLALIGSLALWLLLISSSKARKPVLIVAGLTVFVLILRPGVWESLKTLYDSTLDPTSVAGSSYEYRYLLWTVVKARLNTTIVRMLWGFGPESFFSLNLSGTWPDGITRPFLSCDSAWADQAISTGYIGLLLTFLLLMKPLVLALVRWRKVPRKYRNLFLLFAINMVAFYFMMISVAMYGWGQNGYMLWILIACSLAAYRVIQHEETRMREGSAKYVSTETSTEEQVSFKSNGLAPITD